MNYVIRALQKKLPRAPLPFNPAPEAVEVNALAQGALRQFTQWSWVEHSTFHVRGILPLSYHCPCFRPWQCFLK